MGNLANTTLWTNGIIPFKFDDDLAGPAPGDISAPVGEVPAGQPGNLPADVRRVQSLLNTFAPGDGGPDPKLAVDGIIGPATRPG